MNLGEALPTTIRHFWPEFNQWLDRIPDSRFLPAEDLSDLMQPISPRTQFRDDQASGPQQLV